VKTTIWILVALAGINVALAQAPPTQPTDGPGSAQAKYLMREASYGSGGTQFWIYTPQPLPEPAPEWKSPSPAEPAVDSFAPVAMSCPKCRAGHVYRLHARTLFERAVRAVGERRLFACDECDWRGWLVPVDIGVAASETAFMKPDLGEIDAALALSRFLPERTPPGSLN